MGNCKTCKHWNSRYDSGSFDNSNQFGRCLRIHTSYAFNTAFPLNSIVTEDVPDGPVHTVTGPEFGCVLHEEKGEVYKFPDPAWPDGSYPEEKFPEVEGSPSLPPDEEWWSYVGH